MKQDSNSVAVTYIGRRPAYLDRLYGSKLAFEQGQTRALAAPLARQFLRHTDLFARAEGGDVTAATDNTPDDTAETLARSRGEGDAKTTEMNRVQDLRDQVVNMDKNALELYARTNYRMELDKRLSVGKLREQVIGFIDQFGAL